MQQQSLSLKSTSERISVTLSMMDFFDRFVRGANEKGLLKTPLGTPLSKEAVSKASIALINAAKVPDSEFIVTRDNYGGTVGLTQAGLSQIQRYLIFTQQSKAAVVIQKYYKGYKARKQFSTQRIHVYYENYINDISDDYHIILNSSRSNNGTPSSKEIDFMNKLNDEETFRVCNEYLRLLAIEERKWVSKKSNRITLLPGLNEYQNTLSLYQEFSHQVLNWIGQVLKIRFRPDQDFLTVMRSGDILCRLTTELYQNVDCSLADKPLHFGLHKTIFFLELCKSLHIKRALLFKISDLFVWPENDLNKKHALIVLRSVVALEKHARNSGWEGPRIEFQRGSEAIGVAAVNIEKPEPVTKTLTLPSPPMIMSPIEDDDNSVKDEEMLNTRVYEKSENSYRLSIPLGFDFAESISADTPTLTTPPITPLEEALDYQENQARESVVTDGEIRISSYRNNREETRSNTFDELYDYMGEGDSLYEDDDVNENLSFLQNLTSFKGSDVASKEQSVTVERVPDRNQNVEQLIEEEVILILILEKLYKEFGKYSRLP